jgi:hypothetical protein
MAAVENLCSRGIWIAQGRVQLDGPMREVIEAYTGSFASADSASKALTAADGRRGSGEIRFTRVEFRSTAGNMQTVTRAGKSLVIRLHYRANEPIERPAFALRMYTELGTLVTDTGTWLHGLAIPLIPAGDGYVDLEIDSLNLTPGRYYFSLFLASDVETRLYDALEHAIYLDIEEAPIYGQSRHRDSRFGLVFFPQRWRLDGIGSGAGIDVTPAANG